MVDVTVVGGYRSTKSAFGDEMYRRYIAAVVFLLTYKILAKCEQYALRFLKAKCTVSHAFFITDAHRSSQMQLSHRRVSIAVERRSCWHPGTNM